MYSKKVRANWCKSHLFSCDKRNNIYFFSGESWLPAFHNISIRKMNTVFLKIRLKFNLIFHWHPSLEPVAPDTVSQQNLRLNIVFSLSIDNVVLYYYTCKMKIYSFKPQPNRFLSFFIEGRKIVITNAFRKKSDKIPKNEKKRAIDYRLDYLSRTEKGTYYGKWQENNEHFWKRNARSTF